MAHDAIQRICLVSHNPFYRDTRVRKYARALEKWGVVVHILCPRGSAQEEAETVRVINIPTRRAYGGRLGYIAEYTVSLLFYTLYLFILHLRFRYDVIQVHNGPDFLIVAALLPRLLGAKLVLDIRDPMPELYQAKFGGSEDSPQQRILRWLEQNSCRLAHAVITANHLFRDTLVGRGLSQDKVTVITNAPNTDLFCRDRAKTARRDGFTLLYVGTVAPRYGLDVAIRAVADLAPDLPGLRLRVVGPLTSYTDSLVALVVAAGIPDRVEFVPEIPYERVPQEMASAQVGIYPAILTPHTDAATPCKVLEYVVMGMPVIAARLRILQQLLGEDALAYFEPGNVRDMSARIRELYDDPVRAASLVRTADLAMLAGDVWELQERVYERLLGRLLCPRRSPSDSLQEPG